MDATDFTLNLIVGLFVSGILAVVIIAAVLFFRGLRFIAKSIVSARPRPHIYDANPKYAKFIRPLEADREVDPATGEPYPDMNQNSR